MRIRALTALEVSRLRKRPGTHRIDKGLYLRVRNERTAWWVFRYMRDHKAHSISLGVADRPLAEVRAEAARLRLVLERGEDPLAERGEPVGSRSFREVAEELIEAKRAGWRNAKHAAQWQTTLRDYAYPILGNLDVKAITTDHVLRCLKPIWSTKPETAQRVRQRIEAVLAAATARGLRDGANPATWKHHLDKLLPALPAAKRVKHHPALAWRAMPAFMARLRQRPGIPARALEFVILTAARVGEAVGATWDEADLEAGIWTVPGERMKAGRPHRVPLSADARALLRGLPRIEGNSYLFPGQNRGRPLSAAAVAQALKALDATVTVHGFRSSFRDWCREATRFEREVAEAALAHVLADKTEAAYARGDLLERRRELMEAWAHYLSGAAATVVPLRRGA